MTTNEKLTALRRVMAEKNLDAYIVVDADPHISEYAPDHYKERRWLSGFTGSAGIAVVTANASGLWTDGRYEVQAGHQLADSEIKLYCTSYPETPTIETFLLEQVPQGGVVGCNGRLFSIGAIQKYEASLSAKGILMESSHDLIADLWTEGRPAMSDREAFLYGEEYSGRSTADKLADLRASMAKHRLNSYVICSLEGVNWLCNMRGFDIVTTPVVSAFMLVTGSQATLFMENQKLGDELFDYLTDNDVMILDYEDIYRALGRLPAGTALGMAENGTNAAIWGSVGDGVQKVLLQDLVALLKGVKNPVEMDQMRSVHVRDGIAMVKFLYWLSTALEESPLNEWDIARKVCQLREEQPGILSCSFTPIAAYGPNAAMCHYSPASEGSAPLKREGFLLLDSGAQYLGGTTDITRTMALGPITQEQRRDFTLVLKSFLGLSMVRFLEGSTGAGLDILARKVMWDNNLNYNHGTGHGVGCCLGVHEGPVNTRNATLPLAEGMVMSVEPGIYKAERHGIRTENLVMVVKADRVEGVGQFYRLEPLTLCPIDLSAADLSLLTQEEKDWINSYHARVYETLAASLTREECQWLEKATAAI